MGRISFDTEQMRSCADAMQQAAPPAYHDALAVCRDGRIAAVGEHVAGRVAQTVAHAVVITAAATEQIDHEVRALRYKAAIAELIDGRADERTLRDLAEMGAFLAKTGAALLGGAHGPKLSTSDVALFLDLYGELESTASLLVDVLARGSGAGDALSETAKGAKFLKDHAAARTLLTVLGAFNVLHTASQQYRDSAAETETGRVTTALGVAIASGALGVLTRGAEKVVVGLDQASGLNVIEGTMAGTSDQHVTEMERLFTGDDRSVQRFEDKARDFDYGPKIWEEQVRRDAEAFARDSIERLVDGSVRSIQGALGLSSPAGSSW